MTKVPKAETLRVDGLPDCQAPVFASREGWYREAYDTDFAVFNRLNPSGSPIPEDKGGSFIMYPFVHTFNQLVPPEEYFGTHPEYFSLVKGERRADHNGTQLCLTNPEVVRVATATVFRWIAEHPEANVFSIDQNDGDRAGECANCVAVDAAEGSPSGNILNFVNQIADAVAEKHPEVRLQTLAYAYSEVPPKTVRPRLNVTIRMCHYEYCEAHPIGKCDDHLPFVKRLEGWSKITNSITIWAYFTNFRHYLIPYPNFESVITHPRSSMPNTIASASLPRATTCGSRGVASSLWRAWVFAQLMWDPYQDGRALIQEFVENVYGPAAPFIRTYIEEAEAAVQPKEMRFSIFASLEQMSYLTPEFLARAEVLFCQAEAAAQGDPALLKRVELAHLPIHYARLQFYAIGGAAYLGREEMPAVLEAFKRIMADTRSSSSASNWAKRRLRTLSSRWRRPQLHRRLAGDWSFDNKNRAGFSTPSMHPRRRLLSPVPIPVWAARR